MIVLPKKCYVNKFIPKKVFYEKIGISSSLKEEFINKVEKITWLYKMSEDTIGISKTADIEEIQIFEVDLKEKVIPNSILKVISKSIPYKILFILKYESDICYAIRVNELYYLEWNEDISIDFNYINLQMLYESIVKKIIKEESNKENFEDIIEKKNKIELLNKDIEKLSSKVKTEKQFDRKVELNNHLNKLRKELEELKNE